MAKDQTIEERIRTLVVDNLGVSDEEVTSNASFEHDLHADSLDIVELVMAIEESFEIDIPNEEADELKTFGLLVEYMTKRATKKKAV